MLFIMRGTSCSGKDTFIDEHFPDRNQVLSSDEFRGMLLGDIGSQQYNYRVFELIHEILEIRFLNRVKYTVFNATNLRMKDCTTVIELCKKYQVPFTFISITPPSISELKYRNSNRVSNGHFDVPDGVLEKHHHRYEASMCPFLTEATNNPLCTWIEVGQNWEVINHVS